MNRIPIQKRATWALLFFSCAVLPARAQQREIDAQRSVIQVHVFKTGFLSAFGHNHLIEAPVASGEAAISEKPSLRLRIQSEKLRVLDPEASQGTRDEIEKTMKGSAVLDTTRFPEIVFESTSIEKRREGEWTVRGNLTLHGATRPVDLGVKLADGRYRGSVSLRQRDFGIEPVSVAGGTVKVKDEIRIDFDVTLVPQ